MKNSSIFIQLPALLFALCFSMQQGMCQSVDQYIIASAGATTMLSGGNSLTFTTGEAIITTAGSNPIMSQGFNQPSLNIVPLPVQMTFSGKAEENANLLLWETYHEENNNYFALERSIDGIKFVTITRVATKAPGGNSAGKISYSYTDEAYANGINYYRLKQVDINGKFVYSPVVKLNNSRASLAFSVSPNPAINIIQILVPEPGTISVIDINGKVLLKEDMQSAGNLDISSISSGAYFINFRGITTNASLRFVKK
ncbi:T9SS type A sorting domain-containing protein [Taibaiella lutea]|uniref:T9SS type A sorting domain-containing protein n=1 Tax=Taibaiella lutea TaxID=2608001 RepID=A0A5M6CBW8_9BACT|nr:T9SS type A sorting domain-containing protein [Taibaiella lutea]KAA5532493.1 T9SS type A sorting domain-containing protein [Taibaiella lutea]